jgi:hypothetical protein
LHELMDDPHILEVSRDQLLAPRGGSMITKQKSLAFWTRVEREWDGRLVTRGSDTTFVKQTWVNAKAELVKELSLSTSEDKRVQQGQQE